MGSQVKYGSRARMPTTIRLLMGIEKLVKHAIIPIQHQHMAISGAIAATLDQWAVWNRIGAGIALITVTKVHRHLHLVCHYRIQWNTNRTAIIGTRAKIGMQVAYRAGRYGLTKPAREMLWTVLSREEKYKAKPFLDAAVYRGGDLVSGWIYAGLAAAGMSIGAIALASAPVAGLWALLALNLGRREEELANAQGEQT